MKGKYKKPDGEIVEVAEFDEANKMVRVSVNELQSEWVGEAEYSKWESVGTETVSTAETITIDEPPAEPEVLVVVDEKIEKPKKKTATKKAATKTTTKKPTKKKWK